MSTSTSRTDSNCIRFDWAAKYILRDKADFTILGASGGHHVPNDGWEPPDVMGASKVASKDERRGVKKDVKKDVKKVKPTPNQRSLTRC